MTKGKKQMDGTGRCRIEFGLAAGESERTIAKEIGVSLSTVSREIRKHTYESFKGCYGRANQCVHRQDCRLTGVHGDGTAAELHIAKIDPKEVVLKPRLVGIEMK